MEMKKSRNNTHTRTLAQRHTPLDNEPSDQKGTGNAEVNQLKPFLGLEKTTAATLGNILDIRLGREFGFLFLFCAFLFPSPTNVAVGGWLRFSTPSSPATLLHTPYRARRALLEGRAGRPSLRIDIPVCYCLGKCTLKGFSSFHFLRYSVLGRERMDESRSSSTWPGRF